MSTVEKDYLSLCEKILSEGEKRGDRTGTGTISLFGERLVINLNEGFPLLTTKNVPFKAVLSELIWFLEGSSDERRLAEILHGTRDPSKKTIWSPNAESTTGSKYTPKYPGDLGRVYGVQWRNWATGKNIPTKDKDGHVWYLPEYVDQIDNIVQKLKNIPTDRRIILSAWNVGELDEMALPPCHMMAQFYVRNGDKLDCQMYQRSVDTFLGLPFNIASYALLIHILASEADLTPGKLTMVLGDTHIYSDHVEQVNEQLSRTPRVLPDLIVSDTMTLSHLKMEDFALIGYDPHPAIKARMAA